MALISKIKSTNVSSGILVSDVANKLGCNYVRITVNNVVYDVLTMEDIITVPIVIEPKSGIAITGQGTDTWTLYAWVNGAPVTTANIKTITNKLYYIKHDNYIAFGGSSTYLGYGFIKGKDMTMPNTPDMWACYTPYSGNTNTSYIYLWDANSVTTNAINSLVALTNDTNLVIMTPLFNPLTGWVSSGSVYFATERPSAYNTINTLYDFVMNNKNYALFTCFGSISSAKSMICFDYTDAI